ncbi:glutathione S-transferase N-terminal domain-containing protein [Devosia sp.]|uniref:glutathione S-transferase N-terminal domain-containing protein n=1 Tax=Devosia sp. TaxID=1871048 RepID=UPI002F19FD4C
MKLIFANRNYSSWSLRAWLVLRHFDIPFEEELVLLSGDNWRENIRARSPTGRVPVLVDGDLVLPETTAIIEYLADCYPDKAIWPADRKLRARARAASAEMHAGFPALRSAAPMNLRSVHAGKVDLDTIADDLARVEALWGELLDRSGGPYLFGAFTAADAMYAPLATRLRTYALPASDTAEAYVEAIYAVPAFQEWLGEALREPWIVEDDEIDFIRRQGPAGGGA